MKYMVMECHLSYAVVLDEDGRFLNVANRNYEVGQVVSDVVVMEENSIEIDDKPKPYFKWIASISALAACLVIAFTTLFQSTPSLQGSIYMTINPEVRIDVGEEDIVIDIEGINEDGHLLIENYDYENKEVNLVMDELIDRAIEMGYLYEGGQITLTLDAESGEWITNKQESLRTHLNEYLTDKLSVTIEITNQPSENQEITIPVPPNNSSSNENDSGYEDAPIVPPASQPNTNSQDDYDDDDYGENAPSTNDDPDEDTNNDGDSGYDKTETEAQSNYGDSSYENNDDGNSNYE